MVSISKFMRESTSGSPISSILNVAFLFVNGLMVYSVVTQPLFQRIHTVTPAGPKPTQKQQGQIFWSFLTPFHRSTVYQKTYGLFSGSLKTRETKLKVNFIFDF